MLSATLLGRASSSGQDLYQRNIAGPSRDRSKIVEDFQNDRHDRYGQRTSERGPIRRTITPFYDNQDSEDEWTEEELVWYERTVVWSRGVEVFRRYTYDHGGEDVAFACFAWFIVPGTDKDRGGKKKDHPPSSSTPGTFGPFHRSQHMSWGQPRPPDHQQDSSHLERTLVVFLQTRAHVYYASGKHATMALPFIVDEAWALHDGGLLVQRALEKRELRRFGKGARKSRTMLRGIADQTSMSILDDLVDLEDEAAPSLPRLYTVESPFDELKMVVEGQVESSPGVPSVLTGSTAQALGETIRVIFVASKPYPFVVTYDRVSGEFVIYHRVLIPTNHENPPAPPNPLTMRPKELLRPNDVTQQATKAHATRPSLQRNTSSFGPSAGERRMSIAPDRFVGSQRRPSRISRGVMPDPSSTDDLQAALNPPLIPVSNGQPRRSHGMPLALNAPSTTSAFVEGNNRAQQAQSLLMNEIHIPQAQEAIHVAAEKDFREMTMMRGLEREETDSRSELVLSVIARWKQPFPPDPDEIRVFLSDHKGPRHVMINLHLTPADQQTTIRPQLFLFETTLKGNESPCYKISLLPPIECVSAVPILSTRASQYPPSSEQQIYDVLVIPPGRDPLLVTDGQIRLPVAIDRGLDSSHCVLKKLIDPVGPRFSAIYEDGLTMRFSMYSHIRHELTQRCCESLSTVLSVQDYSAFREKLLISLKALPAWDQANGEAIWNTFSDQMVSMLRMGRALATYTRQDRLLRDGLESVDPVTRRLAGRLHKKSTVISNRVTPSQDHNIGSSLQQYSPSILLVFHLVAQDYRLARRQRKELARLVELVVKIAARMGKTDWVDYWERILPIGASGADLTNDYEYDTRVLDRYEQPPDILLYLSRQMSCPTREFPLPGHLPHDNHHSGMGNPDIGYLGKLDVYPRISLLTSIYQKFGSHNTRGSAAFAGRADSILSIIMKKVSSLEWLSDLPYGLAIPIWECLRACQCAPKNSWSSDSYRLLGRPDLAMQAEKERVDENLVKDDWPAKLGPNLLPDVRDIIDAGVTGATGQSTKTPLVIPHVRFGTDRRLQEVERIMQTTKLRLVTLSEPKGASPDDVLRYQQSYANTLANRTLAITVGQGIFEYGTRNTVITDTWEIPFIELSVKITPGNTVLKAEIVTDSAEWPCFHNGVSTALSISPDCKGIDSSWIVFNRPQTLNAEHGGFLFGLGLTGHLRSLMTYHAFPLMEPRHDFTSVGLLLGLASSFAGSNDLLITRILSLHTHAMLPPGSMELNASPIIQSSALVGLGLVYVGSRNLRMAEVALSEIGRQEMPNVDGFAEYQESYSFSAAMSYGLIMLGRGGSTAGEVDRKMLAQLRRCIFGDVPSLDASKSNASGSGVDINLTAPGATLALGLTYLKTMRRDVADVLEIPQTAFDLDNVKPEWLLVRTFARALILWDDIVPSMAWVQEKLPKFVSVARDSKRSDLAMDLAYINIIAGAGLALGLKYAGTATELAHNTILLLYADLLKIVTHHNMSYEGRIKRTSARQALNVVTIALAAVMSGTGELGVLRRLRVSHGQEGAGVTYGTHMAMHMALGLLFLGRGQFTLGNSNLAIAAMSIAFFPRFLPTPSDNKAYPQAFRHLWALAVEARCLVARDVETLETVYLPVKLRFRDGTATRQQSLISPTQLPSFDRLLSVEVESPRYWAVKLDLSNPRDREALIRTRTIYVKRKAGFIDYDSDPKGNRSIFVRVGSMAGIDLQYDLISRGAPPNVGVDEVKDLVRVHSGDAALTGLAEHFENVEDKWGGGMGAFLRTVIVECLALDKPQFIGLYVEMYLALRRGGNVEGMEDAAQFGFAKAFYEYDFDKNFAQMHATSEKRFALMRFSFLSAAKKSILGSAAPHSKRDGEWAVVERYLQYGVDAWKDDSKALSKWLARNNVPPLPLLNGLKQKLNESTRVDDVKTELLLRQSAEQYCEALWSMYDERPERVSKKGEAWKLHSVQQAMKLWKA